MTDQKQIEKVRSEYAALIGLSLNSPLVIALPYKSIVRALIFNSDKTLSCRQLSVKYCISHKTASNIIKEKTYTLL